MKRIFIVCLAVFGLFLGSTAHPVDQETARAVATKFMKAPGLHLAATYQTDKGIPAFYIFNDTEGFVIVSADDCETPIIGYSREHPLDPNDIPIQMEEYLQGFVSRIQYGMENHFVADEATARQWALVKATGRLKKDKTAKAVAPLITTRWHQGCLYNSLCPEMDHVPCGHAEVGCVAVAMAQIMHYWNFPQVGNGSNAYYAITGELLSADFGNTQYQWDLMPDVLSDTSSTAEVDAVATLLYHCGIAVHMLYTDHGSGAHSSDVPAVLKRHFFYSNEMHRETMGNEPDLWLLKLKDCLDRERPVLYSGQGSSGHAFVCDGYDENDLLHFNWGWGGNGDGYYSIGSLNPLGHDYNSSNGAIFDIVPGSIPVSVTATANPPYGGSVDGFGTYLPWEQCVLTASPSENFEFLYWKKDGQIVSYENPYPMFPIDSVNDFEAVFSLKSVLSVAANASGENAARIACDVQSLGPWLVLKHFNIQKVQSIATDGNRIYLCKRDNASCFWEYSMDGLYIRYWTHGIGFPVSLTYDGESYYCYSNNSAYLYSYDMANNSLVSSVRTGYSPICSYDPVRDGMWIARYDSQLQAYRLHLIDLTGTLIQQGPLLPSEVTPNGSGLFEGMDRDIHLLIKTEDGHIYDYDIDMDLLYRCNADLGVSYGSFIGDYQGRTAMYVCLENAVRLFDIKSVIRPWPITCYRLYRSDEAGNVVLVADEFRDVSYSDATWAELGSGVYRYGISMVFANGKESEIIWSDPIPKGNYGLEENEDSQDEGVQKVYENGQIVIIKDGKRYNVAGQEIEH